MSDRFVWNEGDLTIRSPKNKKAPERENAKQSSRAPDKPASKKEELKKKHKVCRIDKG